MELNWDCYSQCPRIDVGLKVMELKAVEFKLFFLFFNVHMIDVDYTVICPRGADAKLYGIYLMTVKSASVCPFALRPSLLPRLLLLCRHEAGVICFLQLFGWSDLFMLNQMKSIQHLTVVAVLLPEAFAWPKKTTAISHKASSPDQIDSSVLFWFRLVAHDGCC